MQVSYTTLTAGCIRIVPKDNYFEQVTKTAPQAAPPKATPKAIEVPPPKKMEGRADSQWQLKVSSEFGT